MRAINTPEEKTDDARALGGLQPPARPLGVTVIANRRQVAGLGELRHAGGNDECSDREYDLKARCVHAGQSTRHLERVERSLHGKDQEVISHLRLLRNKFSITDIYWRYQYSRFIRTDWQYGPMSNMQENDPLQSREHVIYSRRLSGRNAWH